MSPPRFHPRSRLYAIVDTGYVPDADILAVTRALIAGGAGVLQLRAKNRGLTDIHALGAEILPICRDAGVPFIINDFPAIAAALGADGVHLGQDDGQLVNTRAIVGPDTIIGRSTHSLQQALAAAAEGFDYIGFGPLYPTGTKPGRSAIGLDDIAATTGGAACPVFCIGGINSTTLPAVLAAGAHNVVVVSALLQAPDIAAATRWLVSQLDRI